jgi:hypothetical protein
MEKDPKFLIKLWWPTLWEKADKTKEQMIQDWIYYISDKFDMDPNDIQYVEEESKNVVYIVTRGEYEDYEIYSVQFDYESARKIAIDAGYPNPVKIFHYDGNSGKILKIENITKDDKCQNL